jgi:hypothetical protein
MDKGIQVMIKPYTDEEIAQLLNARFTKDEIMELEAVSSKRYVSTKDRMDVEDAIQHVEITLHDIKALIELYVDRRDRITEDEMWNYLEGIKCMLELRVNALWDAHRQREHIDGFGTMEEVLANHAKRVKADNPPAKKKASKKK